MTALLLAPIARAGRSRRWPTSLRGGAAGTAYARPWSSAVTVLACGAALAVRDRVRRSMSRWAACCAPTRSRSSC